MEKKDGTRSGGDIEKKNMTDGKHICGVGAHCAEDCMKDEKCTERVYM